MWCLKQSRRMVNFIVHAANMAVLLTACETTNLRRLWGSLGITMKAAPMIWKAQRAKENNFEY